MRLKNVFGILLGSIIGLLIVGFWRGEFDWNVSIAVVIGVSMGYLALAFIKNNQRKNELK